MADHGNHLVGVERLAHDALRVLVDADVVGVHGPAGYDDRIDRRDVEVTEGTVDVDLLGG